jgi:hypothetical protein
MASSTMLAIVSDLRRAARFARIFSSLATFSVSSDIVPVYLHDRCARLTCQRNMEKQGTR